MTKDHDAWDASKDIIPGLGSVYLWPGLRPAECDACYSEALGNRGHGKEHVCPQVNVQAAAEAAAMVEEPRSKANAHAAPPVDEKAKEPPTKLLESQ